MLVLVEGIDVLTSDSLQCRHSYTGDDIVWDHTFEQCVTEGAAGECLIDFGRFHDLRPVPPTSQDGGPVVSHS